MGTSQNNCSAEEEEKILPRVVLRAADCLTFIAMLNGYVLIPDVEPGHISEILADFGEVIPQYDGSLAHEVKSSPQNQHLRFSQSANTIQAHTEAPGWPNQPPRYLALYCRTQARCGGGHTDLLDGKLLFESLTTRLRKTATEHEVYWPPRIRSPLFRKSILRYSHNLLTTGEYEPSIDTQVNRKSSSFVKLANFVESFFQAQKVEILVPEKSMLIWDNHRMLHARSCYDDHRRHLTRYWVNPLSSA